MVTKNSARHASAFCAVIAVAAQRGGEPKRSNRGEVIMIAYIPLAHLTADEREACRSYQVDSTWNFRWTTA